MKMKSKLFFVIIAIFFAMGLCVACTSGPKASSTDLTGVTTYYVRADGNDKNTGISEDAPFQTLGKAVQAASGTSVKTITVIGTLDGQTEITNSGTGVILVTGKANASDNEKAVLTTSAEKTNVIGILENANIRFEHLTVTTMQRFPPIYIEGGNAKLTLGRNTVVSNNRGIDAQEYPRYGGGVLVVKGGTLVMGDNAMITNSAAAAGGGVAVFDGATLIMQDNAVISNNVAKSDHFDNGGGGGIYSFRGKVTLKDKASVTGNTANHAGGIILRLSAIETADGLQVEGSDYYESSQVIGNIATGQWLGGRAANNIQVHDQ
jgi:hypothetical protein